MTLAETLLPRLADWTPPGPGRHIRTEHDAKSGWSITITADRVDSLGCLIWEVELDRSGADITVDVANWAQRVSERSTALMGPLAVLEVDSPAGVALLRSARPDRRGDDLTYFEARLTAAGKAAVRRFRASRGGGRRQQVAYPLTHEALARLAEEFVGSC